MKAGDTFLIPNPATSYDSHLWMVISDPSIDGRCVIVSFTTWRADKDQACIVDKGDHRYLRHKTCVNFQDCKIIESSDLDQLIAARNLQMHDPLSPELLSRIRSAVADSRMKLNAVDVLLDQGVVTLD